MTAERKTTVVGGEEVEIRAGAISGSFYARIDWRHECVRAAAKRFGCRTAKGEYYFSAAAWAAFVAFADGE